MVSTTPKISSLAGYNLMDINRLINEANQGHDKTRSKAAEALKDIFFELNKLLSDSKTVDEAALWFAQILPLLSEKTYPAESGHGYVCLFYLLNNKEKRTPTDNLPSLLETAVRSENSTCLKAILNHLSWHDSYFRLGNQFFQQGISLVDRLFLSGHFDLVNLIFKKSDHELSNHKFPPLNPMKSVEKQRNALIFLFNHGNHYLIKTFKHMKNDVDTFDFIDTKINKISIPLDACDWLLLKFDLGDKKALSSFYLKLDDDHKMVYIDAFFRHPKIGAQINSYLFNHLDAQEKQNFANLCKNNLGAVLPHFNKIPYDICNQKVSLPNKNQAHHALFHCWLVDRNTSNDQIEKWCQDRAHGRNWSITTGNRYALLRETCLYYRKRDNIQAEFYSFLGIKGGISKFTKLSAVRKLHSKLLDESTEITFTQDEIAALKQGTLGKICSQYKTLMEQITADSNQPSDNATPGI